MSCNEKLQASKANVLSRKKKIMPPITPKIEQTPPTTEGPNLDNFQAQNPPTQHKKCDETKSSKEKGPQETYNNNKLERKTRQSGKRNEKETTTIKTTIKIKEQNTPTIFRKTESKCKTQAWTRQRRGI